MRKQIVEVVLFLLQLRMKIDDVEISWALGATLDLFEKMT